MSEKDHEVQNPSFIKMIIIFVVPLLILMVGVHLYSLTPQAIQSAKDHQKELDGMTCSDLFNNLVSWIPHGYSVGSSGLQLDEYSNELKIKDCIKK